mmetsp:Transcript_3576/g.12616  ORF Transcript_3576/g.12616 Transcript_3576/m.12616 type:complete len:222 (+) Transcript_3576:741-1406(+)
MPALVCHRVAHHRGAECACRSAAENNGQGQAAGGHHCAGRQHSARGHSCAGSALLGGLEARLAAGGVAIVDNEGEDGEVGAGHIECKRLLPLWAKSRVLDELRSLAQVVLLRACHHQLHVRAHHVVAVRGPLGQVPRAVDRHLHLHRHAQHVQDISRPHHRRLQEHSAAAVVRELRRVPPRVQVRRLHVQGNHLAAARPGLVRVVVGRVDPISCRVRSNED